MAGKSVRFKLGNTTVKGVFRHKWDSPGDGWIEILREVNN